jgi:hypothetical protein
MARLLSDPAVQAEMEALGTADLVLGLPTVGRVPSAEAVGRVALEGRLGSMATVVVHVDPTGSGEVVEALTRAVAPCPLVHLEGSGLGRAPTEPEHHADGVRTVLAAGRQLRARGIVLLTALMDPAAPGRAAALVEPVLKDGHGLVLPMYTRTRYEGTLTHALVVPLVRALWGRRLAHPMAEEFACSGEAAAAFLEAEAWETGLARQGLEFWLPVAAIQAGVVVSQAGVGQRPATDGPSAPLGATVGRVAGALFALAEQTESHWLEVRGSESVPASGPEPPPREGGGPVDPGRLLAGFRQGVRDLLEIWVRILAPDTLVDVLALADLDEIQFSDRLWARVVYDFLLAWRFRVAHRGHVAQSLAPLYLGRTASLILETRGKPATAVAAVGERLARGFEDEKAYLVDRWR